MLLLLLIGAGTSTPGVRAYGLVAFTLAQNGAADFTLANPTEGATTTAYDGATEID